MKFKGKLDWIFMTGDGLFLGASAKVDVYNEDGFMVNVAITDSGGPWEDATAVLTQMGSKDTAVNMCGFVHEDCCVVGASYKNVVIVHSVRLSDTAPLTVSKCYTKLYEQVLKTLAESLK